jgi:negative regulator of flagellin synthesis FlgM
MKITDIHGLGIEQVQAGQTGAVASREDRQTAAASGGGDVIQLSDTARLMQKASEAIADTEEVRPEKVMALRDAVQQGTYEVDPQQVAKSLIVNLLQER